MDKEKLTLLLYRIKEATTYVENLIEDSDNKVYIASYQDLSSEIKKLEKELNIVNR